jgi:aryl-alcohol dehydrogenase-like predicted oxidoreductase
VDTADAQGDGHAERLIGKVLREFKDREIHVVGKVGRLRGSAAHPYAGPRVRHQLEQTLENLYQEDLAVYVLDSYDFGPGDRYLGPVVAQMRAMRDLGQIQAIGLRGPTSADSPMWARRFLQLFEEIEPDIVWAQVNGLLPAAVLDSGENLCEFTARQGAGLVLASPLAHGLLAGDRNPRALAALCDGSPCPGAAAAIVERGLRELTDRFGREPGTLVRLALRARLQQSPHAVVAVGVADERLVEQCFGCLFGLLTEDQLGHIDDVFTRIRLGLRDLAGGYSRSEVSVGGAG